MRSPSAAARHSPVSSKSVSQTVDPEPTVGVEHHFDDGRIVEPICDCWPKRSAQHACAARDRLRLQGMNCRHLCPQVHRKTSAMMG